MGRRAVEASGDHGDVALQALDEDDSIPVVRLPLSPPMGDTDVGLDGGGTVRGEEVVAFPYHPDFVSFLFFSGGWKGEADWFGRISSKDCPAQLRIDVFE